MRAKKNKTMKQAWILMGISVVGLLIFGFVAKGFFGSKNSTFTFDKNTSMVELEQLRSEMHGAGLHADFLKIEYNEHNQIQHIEAKVSHFTGTSSFCSSSFEDVTIAKKPLGIKIVLNNRTQTDE